LGIDIFDGERRDVVRNPLYPGTSLEDEYDSEDETGNTENDDDEAQESVYLIYLLVFWRVLPRVAIYIDQLGMITQREHNVKQYINDSRRSGFRGNDSR
jgi:hypothetical protein